MNYNFPALCTSSTYKKSTGHYFCGFVIKDSLTWYQAADACKMRGGRLPEVYNKYDNIDILKSKVK
jgi:hypothetical protein